MEAEEWTIRSAPVAEARMKFLEAVADMRPDVIADLAKTVGAAYRAVMKAERAFHHPLGRQVDLESRIELARARRRPKNAGVRLLVGLQDTVHAWQARFQLHEDDGPWLFDFALSNVSAWCRHPQDFPVGELVHYSSPRTIHSNFSTDDGKVKVVIQFITWRKKILDWTDYENEMVEELRRCLSDYKRAEERRSTTRGGSRAKLRKSRDAVPPSTEHMRWLVAYQLDDQGYNAIGASLPEVRQPATIREGIMRAAAFIGLRLRDADHGGARTRGSRKGVKRG